MFHNFELFKIINFQYYEKFKIGVDCLLGNRNNKAAWYSLANENEKSLPLFFRVPPVCRRLFFFIFYQFLSLILMHVSKKLRNWPFVPYTF